MFVAWHNGRPIHRSNYVIRMSIKPVPAFHKNWQVLLREKPHPEKPDEKGSMTGPTLSITLILNIFLSIKIYIMDVQTIVLGLIIIISIYLFNDTK